MSKIGPILVEKRRKQSAHQHGEMHPVIAPKFHFSLVLTSFSNLLRHVRLLNAKQQPTEVEISDSMAWNPSVSRFFDGMLATMAMEKNVGFDILTKPQPNWRLTRVNRPTIEAHCNRNEQDWTYIGGETTKRVGTSHGEIRRVVAPKIHFSLIHTSFSHLLQHGFILYYKQQPTEG
ncbi:MAG: hypothetical protein ACRDL7_00975 [Gaiellaceae bacterium]